MQLAALVVDFGMTAGIWQGFANAVGSIMITSIWQGALIVCGLEICLRGMPRLSSAQRFAIWAAGFGVAVGLPLIALLHLGDGHTAAGAAGAGSATDSAVPMLQLDARWGLAIASLWAIASSVRAASLAMHSLRLRRLWKTAKPVETNPRLAAALRNVRRGRVTICTTELLDRPSVIGFLAPRILIPAWLIARLTDDELEQVVLHEAEHLRRGDDWTNLAQKLSLVAFPLNPALAWMEYRLCHQREMACDEGVVRITNAPRAYAACLASLAERGLDRRAEALSLGAWHRRSALVDRVHGILLRKRGLNRAAAAAMLGAVGCALAAGSVEMARTPQLVAFVEPQKNIAMTPERQQQMTEILALESADANSKLPADFKAIPAKASLPTRRHPQVTLRHEMKKTDTTAKNREVIAAPDPQTVAKSKTASDRVLSADGQQWVVLAAWEEVRTVSGTSISDYDASEASSQFATNKATAKTLKDNDPVAANATPRLPNKTSNYTVMQLILRVVPANSNSTQPAIGSVRSGWLVFQL